MSIPRDAYRLYLVTDSDLMSSATLAENVRAACEGGVTLVQLREKHLDSESFEALAREVKKVCDAYDVPLIINDDVRVARAVGADGVHVGQSDMALAEVRALVGGDMTIGVSVSTLEQALEAEAGGADYLGVGAMTYTPTKPDAVVVTKAELARILDAVSIPSVVIGGINAASIPSYADFDVAGYAVVSAIVAADDVTAAAADMLHLIETSRSALRGTCHIVSAGPENSCLPKPEPDDFVIAADAGYLVCNSAGIDVDLLVADFDSMHIEEFEGAACEHVDLPCDKDDTDTLSALKQGLVRGYRNFGLYGALGGDAGHSIANVQCLAFLEEQGAHGVIYAGEQRIELITAQRGERTYHLAFGTRVSVFAFGKARGVTLKGFKWELHDAALDSAYPLGLGNEAGVGEQLVSVEKGVLIVVID